LKRVLLKFIEFSTLHPTIPFFMLVDKRGKKKRGKKNDAKQKAARIQETPEGFPPPSSGDPNVPMASITAEPLPTL
jgi:hypothetical protein